MWCGGVDDGGDVDYVSTSSVAPSFIAFKSHSRFGSSLESRSAIKIDKKKRVLMKRNCIIFTEFVADRPFNRQKELACVLGFSW